jgi:hypothetical protein
VNLLFENISLLLQLDRPSPVVKGAGHKHLVCLVRPAVGILVSIRPSNIANR